MCNENCNKENHVCSKEKCTCDQENGARAEDKVLIIIDMQNDFIDGVLGNAETRAIVPAVVNKIKEHRGCVLYTMDAHSDETYLSSSEGAHLPVPHCLTGTTGIEINSEIAAAREIFGARVIVKHTFGTLELITAITKMIKRDGKNIASIELCGVCTAICVASNATILKTAFPEIDIIVDANCCACVTKETHNAALEVMACQQITILNKGE